MRGPGPWLAGVKLQRRREAQPAVMLFRYGVALQRRRDASERAARGDETVRTALFAAAPAAGRFDRRSHGVLISPLCSATHASRCGGALGGGGEARLGSATQPSPGGLVGLEPRLGRERDEAPPAGRWPKRSTAQRGSHRTGRAREKRCPTLGSDRNVAQQHARAATSQQPARRAAPSKKPPAPRPASSHQR
jgi:hypothetical protein